MALIIKDRVQETSTTSGTGTLTLAGAVTGYQSFGSAIGSGNTTYYGIYETQTTNWEIGVGTVGSGTLARTTVLASSNAGSLVSFGGGQLAVWGDMPAIKGMYLDATGKATSYTLSLPTVADTMQYTPNSSTPSLSKGLVWYDNNNDTLAYYNNDQEVQIGKQVVFRAYNQTGSTITVGQVVYVNGTYIGQYPTIALAQSNSLSTSVVIGITSESISNNAQGYVTISGIVNGVNTSSYSAGTNLFLSATTPGALTSTAPSNPNYSVQVGVCISSNTSGSLLVVPEYLSVPAANVVGTLSNSQLANSAITINGTSTSLGGSINVGTVTSVTGTAPVVSSGGATPAISISQASTSTNGYLSSTDWNTFNGKAPSVTYTTNYVPYGQGTTTLNQASNFTFDGTTHSSPVMQASNGIFANAKSIAASYSIPSADNALSVGPVTVASGQTVTVPSGSRWVIL